jgi:hypothetical protein
MSLKPKITLNEDDLEHGGEQGSRTLFYERTNRLSSDGGTVPRYSPVPAIYLAYANDLFLQLKTPPLV